MNKLHCYCLFILLVIMGTASSIYGNRSSGKSPTASGKSPTSSEKSPKKLYELVNLTDTSVKLIPNIHLVPPGSQLVNENVTFKDIGALPDKEDLEKKARVDINFFEKKLKEDIGKDKGIEFEKAIFNIYKDFVGNYTTDLIFMIYKISK